MDYYQTGYYVDPKNFDVKSGLVKGNEPDKEHINSHIRFMVGKLDDVLTDLKRSGEEVSIQNFKCFYLREHKRDMNLVNYIKQSIEEKKGSITASSHEVYIRSVKKLGEFAPNISVRSIDKAFLNDYQAWLKTKNLCQNTINHYLETLRTFLIKAQDEGIIEINPFRKFKIK